ncbi:MAG: glycoside hydrolase family 127 protein [Planctomycetes bacterium]|nr:glycoside hydrolase family 127 protein [Planctomycetota bacterium]
MPASPKPQAVVVDTSKSPHAQLKPAPLGAVRFCDRFWEPRRKINREVTLPSQYRQCEETGRIDNFRRASGRKQCDFQGIFFNDSDVYKWLEAAAWTLAETPGGETARMADLVIDEIAAAQQPDGYINTYFMFERAAERWSNLKDKHELYLAGHLFQGAVAHYRATGETKLLDVARRFADCIGSVFGPKSEGKREQTDGHEEIEMALVELARATGAEKYLRLARFFVEVRGQGGAGGSPYHQDHTPLRRQDRVIGHAVRHLYFCCAGADLCAEDGDVELRGALDRLWSNFTSRQMYVTGGAGCRYEGEAFGKDYELPNERAYTETCAAIGSVMWNWRMLQLGGEARYADALELALYNGVLAGLSLDGQHYFYQNPLSDDGAHRRQKWFGCACCPPNVARLLAALPGYAYGVTKGGVWAHLYASSAADLQLPEGPRVSLRQRTDYPWDGAVEFEVRTAGEFALHLRVPEWCENGAAFEVNGKAQDVHAQPGAYVEIRRTWKPGDTVRLNLPMPPRRIESHPYALENAGRVALMRGPLVYCVEQADQPGLDPRALVLPASAEIRAEHREELLNGVSVLRFRGEAQPPDQAWSGKLYRSARAPTTSAGKNAEVTAIPYYAWANREPGRMQVWLKRDA